MSKLGDLLGYGQAEVGKPYVFGAEGPNAFDCSGLMQFIFGKIGVNLPRTAAEQQKYATPVATPQPGDLVFWGGPAYHVAMYVGNGQVLSAPHAGANVRIQKIWGNPTYGRVKGVGSSNSVIAAGYGAVQPVALGIDSTLDKIGGFGRLILFAAGGAALVILGGFKTFKGK